MSTNGEKNKNLQLADVRGWMERVTCTPTALAAVSGRSANEIDNLLRKVAAEDKRIIESFREDYSMRDWCEALKRIDIKVIQVEDYRQVPFDDRPTIRDLVYGNSNINLRLVLCDDNKGKGHIFATTAGDVVDTYTNGKRVRFNTDAVPFELRLYRVKRTFKIERLR